MVSDDEVDSIAIDPVEDGEVAVCRIADDPQLVVLPDDRVDRCDHLVVMAGRISRLGVRQANRIVERGVVEAPADERGGGVLGNQIDDLVAVRGGIEQVAAHLGGLRVIKMRVGCKVAQSSDLSRLSRLTSIYKF